MYVLLEKRRATEDDNLYLWDAMGYTEFLDTASKWRLKNYSFREYIFVPNREVVESDE